MNFSHQTPQLNVAKNGAPQLNVAKNGRTMQPSGTSALVPVPIAAPEIQQPAASAAPGFQQSVACVFSVFLTSAPASPSPSAPALAFQTAAPAVLVSPAAKPAAARLLTAASLAALASGSEPSIPVGPLPGEYKTMNASLKRRRISGKGGVRATDISTATAIVPVGQSTAANPEVSVSSANVTTQAARTVRVAATSNDSDLEQEFAKLPKITVEA